MAKAKQSSFFNLLSYLKRNWFAVSIISILLLATMFRFYNFSDRWGLGNDDSRDVAIAQEALRRHELPLIGSFSSAGPFVFGPIFYWFIMGSYIILPFAFTAPWIMTVLAGITTVGILLYTAYRLEGRVFALILGTLAGLSPQLVFRSTSLTQHTFVALFSSLLLLFLVLLFQSKKYIYALLLGLSLGIAINFHYQSLNLLVFLPVVVLLPGIALKKRLLYISLALLGVLLGLFPLLLWDSRQEFANVRNVLDYLLIGQNRIYVPNSWKLFLFTYLPDYWKIVAGGHKTISLALMSIAALGILLSVFSKKLKTIWYYLFIPFGVLLVVNKFYKGERSEGYLLYILPLILFVTAYGVFFLWQYGQLRSSLVKTIAVVILLLVMVGNVIYLKNAFAKESSVKDYEKIIARITSKRPHDRFAIYDFHYQFPHISQPISILLKKRGLTDREGLPLGFIYFSQRNPSHPVITSVGTLAIVDLSNEASLSAQRKTWARLNPEDMYDDLVGRWQKNKLTSSFSLQKYLLERLHFIPSE